MKLITLVFACSLVTSCGYVSRVFTSLTGDVTYKCSKEGVEYIQADSGFALSVDRQGNVVECPK